MRLIDAEKISFKGIPMDMGGLVFIEDILLKIEELPTVDAVPVVRCKDCKHYVTDYFVKNPCYPFPIIAAHEICCFNKENPIKVQSEHYCSCGERKEDGGL